jgi:hypothetical protein
MFLSPYAIKHKTWMEGSAMQQRLFPTVLCPGCTIKMTVKSLSATRANARMKIIVYHCPRCDLETARHMILPDAAAAPRL